MIHLSFDRSFWYCVFLASQLWLRRRSEKTLEVAFCGCISSEVMTLQVHFSSILKRPSALTFKLFLSLVGIFGFSACCLQFGLSFVQSEMCLSLILGNLFPSFRPQNFWSGKSHGSLRVFHLRTSLPLEHLYTRNRILSSKITETYFNGIENASSLTHFQGVLLHPTRPSRGDLAANV